MWSMSGSSLLRGRARSSSPLTTVLISKWISSSASPSKPRVVILGTGWGGFRLAREINKKRYDVTVVSPRNHFLFTPLLPSTTVGTLEFRSARGARGVSGTWSPRRVLLLLDSFKLMKSGRDGSRPKPASRESTPPPTHTEVILAPGVGFFERADVIAALHRTARVVRCTRCIQEPVRTIRGLSYLQAYCTGVDFGSKVLHCREVYKGTAHDMEYDYLVVATGARNNTFGVPGVNEENHVFFLKQLGDARNIRNRLLECFERAASPYISERERSRLLTFIVVGGGPTSIEYAAELHDFLMTDVKRWYPDLRDKVTVVLIEASDHIMGTFDEELIAYTTRLLNRRQVKLLLNTSVKAVDHAGCTLADGTRLPFGLMVWSTGLIPVQVVEEMKELKKERGRIVVDSRLRVPGVEKVFAIGDAAIEPERPLGPLAQVADQQGKYLAKTFSKPDPFGADIPPFMYRYLGSMAQVGDWKAVAEFRGIGGPKGGPILEGLLAFLTWRSAYWTRTVSIANKALIPMHWFKAWAFGRDICRF